MDWQVESWSTQTKLIARRDAEQLIDHRSIRSGTLDETSLQSLGWRGDFAPKTEGKHRETSKNKKTNASSKRKIHRYHRFNGKTEGNCSKHLQLPNVSPAQCIAFLRVPKWRAIHPQLAPALGNSSDLKHHIWYQQVLCNGYVTKTAGNHEKNKFTPSPSPVQSFDNLSLFGLVVWLSRRDAITAHHPPRFSLARHNLSVYLSLSLSASHPSL